MFWCNSFIYMARVTFKRWFMVIYHDMELFILIEFVLWESCWTRHVLPHEKDSSRTPQNHKEAENVILSPYPNKYYTLFHLNTLFLLFKTKAFDFLFIFWPIRTPISCGLTSFVCIFCQIMLICVTDQILC